MSFKPIDHEDHTRPEGKTCLLVYGYDSLEINKIKEYAQSLNLLTVIEIKSSETYSTLEELINEVPQTSNKRSPHASPVIVLNAVSSAELNSFVHNYRALQLKSPLFAVVTETSINWKFNDLVNDLLEERAMFMKMKAQQSPSTT